MPTGRSSVCGAVGSRRCLPGCQPWASSSAEAHRDTCRRGGGRSTRRTCPGGAPSRISTSSCGRCRMDGQRGSEWLARRERHVADPRPLPLPLPRPRPSPRLRQRQRRGWSRYSLRRHGIRLEGGPCGGSVEVFSGLAGWLDGLSPLAHGSADEKHRGAQGRVRL